MNKTRVFTLDAEEWGKNICQYLNMSLSRCENKNFQDGECYCASLENVRGADCYVICSAYTDECESINDKIMKLSIMIGSLKDASAASVNLVIPYYPYGRQDRKTSSRAPITTKYLSKFFEGVGVDRVLTIDPHTPISLQNAYSIPVDMLEANGLFAKYVAKIINEKDQLVVMSPDVGGMNRSRRFRAILEKYTKKEIPISCLDKIHNGDEIKGDSLIGDVTGKLVVVLDDMISSGRTISECVNLVKKHNATSIIVCATHGLFVGKANEYLDNDFVKNIVITDTIKPFRITNPAVYSKISVIHTHHLFAEAIRRTTKGESLSDLIEKNGIPLTFHTLTRDDLLTVR